MNSFYSIFICIAVIIERSGAQFTIALLDGYPSFPVPNVVLPAPDPIPYMTLAPPPLPAPVPIVTAPIIPHSIVPSAMVTSVPSLPPAFSYTTYPHYTPRRTEVRNRVRTYERETGHITETTYSYPAMLRERLHRQLAAMRKAARMLKKLTKNMN